MFAASPLNQEKWIRFSVCFSDMSFDDERSIALSDVSTCRVSGIPLPLRHGLKHRKHFCIPFYLLLLSSSLLAFWPERHQKAYPDIQRVIHFPSHYDNIWQKAEDSKTILSKQKIAYYEEIHYQTVIQTLKPYIQSLAACLHYASVNDPRKFDAIRFERFRRRTVSQAQLRDLNISKRSLPFLPWSK